MKIKLYLLASFFSIFSVIAQEKESSNVYKIPLNRVADIKIDKWIQNKPKDTLLNGKFLVINFWRTNCTVCDEGMKEIEKLQNEFKDVPNLYFINLTDEKATNVTNYFKTSSNPLDPNVVTSVTQKIEDGVSIMNFFGHAAASNNGFESMIISRTRMTSAERPQLFAMYCIINLEASVLPAPDSPEMITHWLSNSLSIVRYISSAMR